MAPIRQEERKGRWRLIREIRVIRGYP